MGAPKPSKPRHGNITAAFLQARMGSSRLPGKVLRPIHGKTILERAVERLSAASAIDLVVVLTTTLERDDRIVDEAARLGVDVFRGPELDVLARFAQAAAHFGPTWIVRATADNPLIDIGAVNRVVAAVRGGGFDYAIESGLPIGATSEAITRAALDIVAERAGEDRHREHVTLYVKERPTEFRAAFLSPPEELERPDLSVTVDTPDDLASVTALIGRIPEARGPVPLECYLALEPWVQAPGRRSGMS